MTWNLSGTRFGMVSPNPALFTNRLHGFLALEARRVAEVRNESTEETQVELDPTLVQRARSPVDRMLKIGRTSGR